MACQLLRSKMATSLCIKSVTLAKYFAAEEQITVDNVAWSDPIWPPSGPGMVWLGSFAFWNLTMLVNPYILRSLYWLSSTGILQDGFKWQNDLFHTCNRTNMWTSVKVCQTLTSPVQCYMLQNPTSSGRKKSVPDANDNIEVLVKETKLICVKSDIYNKPC